MLPKSSLASGWADWFVTDDAIDEGAIRVVAVCVPGGTRYVAFDPTSPVTVN